ncbi:hypothetical protein PIB30_100972, partial [Stylosanthes scabra]|nr:hypothetical protein [Stylosanthes scabra]
LTPFSNTQPPKNPKSPSPTFVDPHFVCRALFTFGAPSTRFSRRPLITAPPTFVNLIEPPFTKTQRNPRSSILPLGVVFAPSSHHRTILRRVKITRKPSSTKLAFVAAVLLFPPFHSRFHLLRTPFHLAILFLESVPPSTPTLVQFYRHAVALFQFCRRLLCPSQ